MSTDFAAFMAARYDEAEALARESHYEGQHWLTEEEGVYRWPDDEMVHMADRKADARFIAANSPAHRLADIALKRAILALYADTLALVEKPPLVRGVVVEADAEARGLTPPAEGMISARDHMDAKRELAVLEPVVCHLGTEFSGHPDYLEEWKP